MPTFFGTGWPIDAGADGRAGGVDFVLAVSRAGGLGTLGAAYLAPDELRRQIRTIRRGTDAAFCVNLILAFDQVERVEVVAEEQVPWLSLSWGFDANPIARAKASGTRVLVQVSSITDARAAIDAGADALVVQEFEAGGHVQSWVALLSLLTRLRTVSVPLVAAGGIADVAGAADAFAAGADAVAMGTRFVASDESLAHPRYRQRLIDATGAGTVLTDLFDSGSPPWKAPHRVDPQPRVRCVGRRGPASERTSPRGGRAGRHRPVRSGSSVRRRSAGRRHGRRRGGDGDVRGPRGGGHRVDRACRRDRRPVRGRDPRGEPRPARLARASSEGSGCG